MRFLVFVLSALGATAATAATDHYTIDPAHANVVWKVNHLGFSNPSGKFADVSGTFDLNELAPDQGKVEVTIKTASIVTGNPKFDEHLRSNDFFFVDQFPTMTYVSTHIERSSADTAEIYGNLTLHGVTKPLMLHAKLNKIGVNPMTQKKTAGFSLSGDLERDAFGMNFAAPMVGNDVTLDIEVEGFVDTTATK